MQILEIQDFEELKEQFKEKMFQYNWYYIPSIFQLKEPTDNLQYALHLKDTDVWICITKSTFKDLARQNNLIAPTQQETNEQEIL